MNTARRMLVLLQAAWAQRTVTLDPEPPGERAGVVFPAEAAAHGDARPLHLVVVGDSMVAGCGVASQDEALTPRIARRLADRTGRAVRWRTHARLGATIRRVRHRFLAEVDGDVDLLLVGAGSNDVMTRRPVEEWDADLRAVLADAAGRARRVVVVSPGQPHESPRLPRALREALAERVDAQVSRSQAVCRELGVPYVDLAHHELPPGFWASDGFHPGARGYEFIADGIVAALVDEHVVA